MYASHALSHPPAIIVRHFWWVLFLLTVTTLLPAPAQADVVGETAEEFAKKVSDNPTVQKEIGEAVEHLVEVLPDLGEAAGELKGTPAPGRPPRGISGPFQELVVNFDKMACAAWIVSYRDWYLGLILKRDPETPPQTLAAAQNLLNKVIYGCRKILDPESYEQVAAPGGSSQPATTTGSASATQTDVIDGELMVTVSDNICWNRCRDKWAAWKGAQAMRLRAEQRLRDARRRADTLESDTIPWMDRRIATAQTALDALKAQRPPYPRRNPDLDRRIGQQEADLANLRAEAARHRADLAALRQEIAGLQGGMAGLRDQERAALQVYLECMRSCATQARAAGDPSSFADRTVENLTARLETLGGAIRVGLVPPTPPLRESSEVRTARLNAIGQLRNGMASQSGTEVALALPSSIGSVGQVHGDVRERMLDAERSGYRHEPRQTFAEVPAASPEVVPAPVTEDLPIVNEGPVTPQFQETGGHYHAPGEECLH